MSSFDPSLVQRRSVKPEPADSRKEGKYICDNRQCSVVQAKINTLIGAGFQNGSKGISKNGTVQREPTEAEKFAKANRDREENKYMALIGSDNGFQSLVAARLKATPKDHPLPSYLSKYLVEEADGKDPVWTQEKNELWMDMQTQEKRNFILKHEAIEKILNKNSESDNFRNEWFKREVKNNKLKPQGKKLDKNGAMTGTWREVEKLLLNGNYKWDNKAGIFFHNETPDNIRLPAIEEEMDIMEKQKPGNGMAAAAGINHK